MLETWGEKTDGGIHARRRLIVPVPFWKFPFKTPAFPASSSKSFPTVILEGKPWGFMTYWQTCKSTRKSTANDVQYLDKFPTEKETPSSAPQRVSVVHYHVGKGHVFLVDDATTHSKWSIRNVAVSSVCAIQSPLLTMSTAELVSYFRPSSLSDQALYQKGLHKTNIILKYTQLLL